MGYREFWEASIVCRLDVLLVNGNQLFIPHPFQVLQVLVPILLDVQATGDKLGQGLFDIVRQCGVGVGDDSGILFRIEGKGLAVIANIGGVRLIVGNCGIP